MKIMIHKVESFISRHKLLTPGAKILVALSGGADSVALLVALLKLGYHCEAVHCNFHLRGAESDRDEAFVKQLCEKKGVKLTTAHFDTTSHAKAQGISIEMAARDLRYKQFEKLRASSEAEAIAVAHHRDDSAETVLLNLIRGTGIKGLRGIQPRNGNIVRPLLCVGRADIIDYLIWRGEEFVTDTEELTKPVVSYAGGFVQSVQEMDDLTIIELYAAENAATPIRIVAPEGMVPLSVVATYENGLSGASQVWDPDTNSLCVQVFSSPKMPVTVSVYWGSGEAPIENLTYESFKLTVNNSGTDAPFLHFNSGGADGSLPPLQFGWSRRLQALHRQRR